MAVKAWHFWNPFFEIGFELDYNIQRVPVHIQSQSRNAYEAVEKRAVKQIVQLPNCCKMTLTESDLQAEWWYRYHERLGVMAGDTKPTEEQVWIASQEASEAIERLRAQKDEPETEFWWQK